MTTPTLQVATPTNLLVYVLCIGVCAPIGPHAWGLELGTESPCLVHVLMSVCVCWDLFLSFWYFLPFSSGLASPETRFHQDHKDKDKSQHTRMM